MIGFAFNGCDNFGDAALFLSIYCILQLLYILGKRLKRGKRCALILQFHENATKSVYDRTTIKFSMSPWYNHGRTPLFIEWSWRSFKSKTLQLASAHNILSTHTVR